MTWTDITRAGHRRKTGFYPSDLTRIIHEACFVCAWLLVSAPVFFGSARVVGVRFFTADGDVIRGFSS